MFTSRLTFTQRYVASDYECKPTSPKRSRRSKSSYGKASKCSLQPHPKHIPNVSTPNREGGG